MPVEKIMMVCVKCDWKGMAPKESNGIGHCFKCGAITLEKTQDFQDDYLSSRIAKELGVYSGTVVNWAHRLKIGRISGKQYCFSEKEYQQLRERISQKQS